MQVVVSTTLSYYRPTLHVYPPMLYDSLQIGLGALILPPAQPVPVLSSMSSGNEVPECAPTSNPSHLQGGQEAQSYYGVRRVNISAPLIQYQPYTIPYQTYPEYDIAGFPYVPIHAAIPPRPELLLSPSQTPFTTAPLCLSQSYLTGTAPTI
jgi:hypothetical protein